jgi:hypothetical protein
MQTENYNMLIRKVVKLFIGKVFRPGIELLEELLCEGIFALEAEDHHPHVPSRGYFEPTHYAFDPVNRKRLKADLKELSYKVCF